jgi:hypothetical protein
MHVLRAACIFRVFVHFVSFLSIIFMPPHSLLSHFTADCKIPTSLLTKKHPPTGLAGQTA